MEFDAPDSRDWQQAAAIAVRGSGDAIEICLIRREDSSSWGIPKGFIDPGDTPEDAALTEAWEEAGLRGRIVGDAIGTYEYEKFRATLVVAVFVMQVLEEDAYWQEARFRERKWMSFEEAAKLLADHPAREFLDLARNVVSSARDR